MADKPTVADPLHTIVDWAPDESEVTEPAGSVKSDGWDATDVPPASYFNWFWKRVGQWQAYFDAHTDFWASGEKSIATQALAAVARMVWTGADPGVADYTLIWRFDFTSEARKVRVYMASDLAQTGERALLITTNARYDEPTNQWVYDTTAGDEAAGAIMLGWKSIRVLYHSADVGADNWPDAVVDWDSASNGWREAMCFNIDNTQGFSEVVQISQIRRTFSVFPTSNAPWISFGASGVDRHHALESGDGIGGNTRTRIMFAGDTAVGDEDAIELTVNAYWDAAADMWERDKDTEDSMLVRLTRSGMRQYVHDDAAADTWADSAWTEVAHFGGLGADASLSVRDSISYSAPPTRYVCIPWHEADWSQATPLINFTSAKQGLEQGENIMFDLSKRVGQGTVKSIRTLWEGDSASATITCSLRRDTWSNVNLNTATMSRAGVATQQHTTTGTAARADLHDFADEAPDHDDTAQTRLSYRILCDPVSDDCDIYGIVVEIEDNSPERY